MSSQQIDHAYRVLLEIAEDMDPPIPHSLLLDLYSIQREHQFEKDRTIPIDQMKQKILAFIDKRASA